MFKTLAKLMGISSPVSTVTVKPKKSKTVTKGETKASLEKMTKKDIDDLAKEKFGVELDRRLTKDKMIVEFIATQTKAK